MKNKIVAMITAGALVASMVSALPAYADESAASSTAHHCIQGHSVC